MGLADLGRALGCDMESTTVPTPPEILRRIYRRLDDAEPMPAHMIIYRRTEAIRMHKDQMQ